MPEIIAPDRRIDSAVWVDASHNSLRVRFVGIADEFIVPDDALNAERQAIQRWQDAGNTISAEPSA